MTPLIFYTFSHSKINVDHDFAIIHDLTVIGSLRFAPYMAQLAILSREYRNRHWGWPNGTVRVLSLQLD